MSLVLLAVVNCYGLKSAAAMMSFFTVCKLMTVVFIMLVGVYHLLWKEHEVPPTFWRPFENLNGELPTVYSVALSFYSVLFAYDGW